MKPVFAFCSLFFCSILLCAREHDPERKYPYRAVSCAEKFPAGNYIFKNTFDRINYMNKDDTKLMSQRNLFVAVQKILKETGLQK